MYDVFCFSLLIMLRAHHLGMTARLFHKLKLLDKAEELYVGALVIDPEVRVLLVLAGAVEMVNDVFLLYLAVAVVCVLELRVSARICFTAD